MLGHVVDGCRDGRLPPRGLDIRERTELAEYPRPDFLPLPHGLGESVVLAPVEGELLDEDHATVCESSLYTCYPTMTADTILHYTKLSVRKQALSNSGKRVC